MNYFSDERTNVVTKHRISGSPESRSRRSLNYPRVPAIVSLRHSWYLHSNRSPLDVFVRLFTIRTDRVRFRGKSKGKRSYGSMLRVTEYRETSFSVVLYRGVVPNWRLPSVEDRLYTAVCLVPLYERSFRGLHLRMSPDNETFPIAFPVKAPFTFLLRYSIISFRFIVNSL